MTRIACDAAVVGSGAAGLTAAAVLGNAGAKVLVAEAEGVLGGTSAIGGGNLWIPSNQLMIRDSRSDSRSEAFTYLRKVSGGGPSEINARAFLEHGPRMVEFLENYTKLGLISIDRPDYHPDWQGAAYGRSLEPAPFEASLLGASLDWFRINAGRPPTTYVEGRTGVDPEVVSGRTARGVRTQGAGLVAGLGHACLMSNVWLERNARVLAVSRVGERFQLTLGGGLSVDAGSLVLASGGFGLNPAMRRAFLPCVEFLPLSAGRGSGDGLDLGLALGAGLSGIGQAWLGAAYPGRDDGPARMVVRDLALPGSLLVNEAGQRFVNEAMGYNDVGSAMLPFNSAKADFSNSRAWLVFDEKFRSKYVVLGNSPNAPAPDHWIRAATVDELASAIAVPHQALETSVRKMNAYAESGVDIDFGRGGDAHQRYNGDDTHAPNPCLGILDTSPYYAVPIRPGICSTKGGLAVNERGQVLGRNGEPVPKLFACGDVAESVMGFGYAGAGASIGPAMTFAMLAAEEIIAQRL